jgi:serine kinase of HPr protein (carbohydrate metabolism regulator)
MSGRQLIHASAVAIATDLGFRAVLLRGPSGSGKSDLAVRLIDAGARLVADDQSEVLRRGDALIVRAAANIAGLIEVRGLGLVRVEVLAEAPVVLIADLAASEKIERLPERRHETLCGISLPLLEIAPFEPSAAAKLRLALHAFTGAGLPAMIGK